LWGDPADKSHDAERGPCALAGKAAKGLEELTFKEENEKRGKSEREYRFDCPLEEGEPHVPLLTLPGSCPGAPLETTLNLDSWQHPETKLNPQTSPNTTAFSNAVTGCDKLRFDASLDVQPEPQAAAADSPSGLNVELKIPHEESVNGRAESNLKEAVVRLPAGMTVSPSAANGLGACSLEQIGLTNAHPASCPDSSRLGTVEITTQLLEHPLKGSVFLAQQGNLAGNGSNPFGSLLALYVVAEGQGVVVKLPGVIELGEEGQLTARFGKDPLTNQYLPQLPFDDLKMSFFGGSRAPLITPSACGTYMTSSQLFPWSGGPPKEPSSSFTVDQGCGAGGFNPSFTAGTSDNQADAVAPGRRTAPRRRAGHDTARPACDHQKRTAVPGAAGVDGTVLVRERNRRDDGSGRAGREPLLGQRRQGLSDRTVWRRPVRSIDRGARCRGAVQSGDQRRARRRQGAHRGRYTHRAGDRHERSAPEDPAGSSARHTDGECHDRQA
jgi:hypothetical protein